MVLQEIIAHLLGEKSLSNICDEKKRQVAKDLLNACSPTQICHLNSADLHQFGTYGNSYYVEELLGDFQMIKTEIQNKVSLKVVRSDKILVVINYKEEISGEDLNQLFAPIKSNFREIMWSYVYDENLTDKNLRLDLIVIEKQTPDRVVD